jgi:glutamate/tyrosine decarboxylase-like PLP-dependent enzyme
MLGLGSRHVELVAADNQGRMRTSELARLLPSGRGPAIVIAQIGEVNTGAVDEMTEVARLTRQYDAWCHVDGAFGLWAAASPTLRGRIDGFSEADSWATDAHKWLNVPYDCGIAIVRDRMAHVAAMNSFAGADYIPQPQHDERYQAEWVPEFSRRTRGFAVYAALRELGRRGVADLVERCCRCAQLMAEELARDPRVKVLNDVVLNQVLVQFTDEGSNITDAIIQAVQDEGTCWLSGTQWEGEPAMRISICNWRTTEDDIRRSATAILAQTVPR